MQPKIFAIFLKFWQNSSCISRIYRTFLDAACELAREAHVLIGHGSDMSVGRIAERVIIVSFIWLTAIHAIFDIAIIQIQEKI